jgi:hypothetical protein
MYYSRLCVCGVDENVSPCGLDAILSQCYYNIGADIGAKHTRTEVKKKKNSCET